MVPSKLVQVRSEEDLDHVTVTIQIYSYFCHPTLFKKYGPSTQTHIWHTKLSHKDCEMVFGEASVGYLRTSSENFVYLPDKWK